MSEKETRYETILVSAVKMFPKSTSAKSDFTSSYVPHVTPSYVPGFLLSDDVTCFYLEIFWKTDLQENRYFR